MKQKSWKTVYKLKNYNKNEMYVDEAKYFFNAIKKKHKTMNDIDDGIKTLGIVLSVKKSSKLGKLVTIK
tara:strand:+ start:4232 stop:4438 length:207 start_codon:yes stop_codon:yes gene_type:complete